MLTACNQLGKCLLLEAAQKIGSQPQQALFFQTECGVGVRVTELLAAKRMANRREYYVKSLAGYLRKFITGREGLPISAFTLPVIEEWLSQYPAAYTRQTWLNRISTLFSFCVRRGYIPANPCDRVERISVDRKPPLVLTPEQVVKLFACCPTVCKPYLALAVFTGIRPEEILRLNWQSINLDTKTVSVDGKTRQRRIVPLEPFVLNLLLEHPVKTGDVAPSHSTVRRFIHKARAVLGFSKWPQDVLRHTAASYLLAKYQDAAKVSLWLGNSPKILMMHYHNPVTQLDCEKFWSLQTKTPSAQTDGVVFCDRSIVTKPGPVTPAASLMIQNNKTVATHP